MFEQQFKTLMFRLRVVCTSQEELDNDFESSRWLRLFSALANNKLATLSL